MVPVLHSFNTSGLEMVNVTPSQFNILAAHSAEKYYSYLEDRNLGLSEITPIRITRRNNEFKLFFHRRIPMPDSIFFRIYGTEYPQSDIGVCSYDDDDKFISIIPDEKHLKLFENLSLNHIVAVSDLKFLVKRVRDWYDKHQVTSPAALPAPDSLVIPDFHLKASKQQMDAVLSVLTNSFTYVWGIPGSGKTSVVLALAILSYVKAGKKVLISAPTNNALEQALCGVIPALDAAGVPRDRILRLGMPSSDFLSLYPEVCESLKTERLLKSLNTQLQRLKEYAPHCLCLSELKQIDEELHDSFYALETLKAEKAATIQHSADLQRQIDQLRIDTEHLRQRQQATSESIKAVKGKLDRMLQKKSSLLFRAQCALGIKDMSALEREITDTVNEQKNLNIALEQVTTSIEKLELQLKQMASKHLNFIQSVNDHTRENAIITKAISKVSTLARNPFFMPLSRAVSMLSLQALSPSIGRIEEELSALYEFLTEKANLYPDIAELTIDELRRSVREIEHKIRNCSHESTELRMTECSVLAATTDTCLYRVVPGAFSPNHIFLDEAAYAPLIKGAALTAYRVPLTLLGDHMQLPPVCEMDDKCFLSEENSSVVLWAQSSLYIEDIFNYQIRELVNRYTTNEAPLFEALRLSFLSHSFRYGNALAALLAEYIYGQEIFGNESCGTLISVIDAPKTTGNSFHESEGEAQAIRTYLLQNPEDDYAVLTPYRAQVKLLSKYIPRDHVFTVHGSQGREWNTVFLSIANQRPWKFTDSTLQVGKRMINTAASRTRNKLIVVCDTIEWRKYPDQLITRLDLAEQGATL